ncbi:MAG: exodeoxyribonuclease VII large subunit [Micrococcales bacterium]
MSEDLTAETSDDSRPYSVSEFNERVHQAINKWPTARIEGELIKFKVGPSGHAYPQLRDVNGGAVLDLTIWRSVTSAFTEVFNDSDRVVVTGKLNFYQPGGKLSLNVTSMKKVGLGDLLAQLEALRAKLRAEGLIDETKRQPLPFLPNRIGLITAQNSDAEQDVVQNVLLRFPNAQFEKVYVPVQGEACPAAVVDAIAKLDANPEVDVIIIARGGGAFLDLIGFSDERVVRAAAAAKTPIVSAIGHEADRPVLDDVADLRASTPTDAAKRVVPDVGEELHRIGDVLGRIVNKIGHYVAVQTDLLAQVVSRPIMTNPYVFLDEKQQDLERTLDELRGEIELSVERETTQHVSRTQVLKSLSPQGTLDRGYSVVRDSDGHVLTDPKKVKAGTKLRVRLSGGELEATSN